jgi:hypothetical protein
MKLQFGAHYFSIVNALQTWRQGEHGTFCLWCRRELRWKFRGSTPIGIGCRCGSRPIKLLTQPEAN